MKNEKLKKMRIVINAYIIVGILFWIIASVFIFTPIIPQVWYAFSSDAVENELISLTQSIEEDQKNFEAEKPQVPVEPVDTTLPPLDKTLPEKNTIYIKDIRVVSTIFENKDPQIGLQNGPWRVTNFGTPLENDKPIIISSHRWGGIGWNKSQREKKSFYLLPSLEKGDIVEIAWGQRLYKYKIYKSTESTKITDYNADLILYTCKMYWESPIRIFKYAVRTD